MDELEFNQALNESAQLLRQNRPGEAEERLLPLYQVSPDHPDVLINLSGAYILQRKWDKAVKLLNKGVKANPVNAMMWMNLGAAHLGSLETAGPAQQAKAIEAYQRALQANPETPNAHYHLGLIYKERGELIRAAAFFQRALEVDPADRDARYWLDRMALLQASETGKEALEEAAQLDEAEEMAAIDLDATVAELDAELEAELDAELDELLDGDSDLARADWERDDSSDEKAK